MSRKRLEVWSSTYCLLYTCSYWSEVSSRSVPLKWLAHYWIFDVGGLLLIEMKTLLIEMKPICFQTRYFYVWLLAIRVSYTYWVLYCTPTHPLWIHKPLPRNFQDCMRALRDNVIARAKSRYRKRGGPTSLFESLPVANLLHWDIIYFLHFCLSNLCESIQCNIWLRTTKYLWFSIKPSSIVQWSES